MRAKPELPAWERTLGLLLHEWQNESMRGREGYAHLPIGTVPRHPDDMEYQQGLSDDEVKAIEAVYDCWCEDNPLFPSWRWRLGTWIRNAPSPFGDNIRGWWWRVRMWPRRRAWRKKWDREQQAYDREHSR